MPIEMRALFYVLALVLLAVEAWRSRSLGWAGLACYMFVVAWTALDKSFG